MRALILFSAFLPIVFLTACGGGTEVKSQTNTTNVSQGQELMDLQKAHDSGAISNSDYEKQKEKILDRK